MASYATAANVPFFAPAQFPSPGTPLPSTPTPTPTIFTPLQIRSVTLPNRIIVSPMCTYSSPPTGHLTPFHTIHLGQFALHGAGLVFVEATAVQPRGRISPHDAGIWSDDHIPSFRAVTDAIRALGGRSALQLAHAGRKAGVLPPWVQEQRVAEAKRLGTGPESVVTLATPEEGGWPDDVVAPSAVPYDEKHAVPRALTVDEIRELVEDYKAAARRGVEAGFDVLEIHGAHGYLLTEFLSPLANKRTDQYGGSFENRTRLLVEIITAVRSVIPPTMPLFLRLSATEWMSDSTADPTLDLATTIRIAKLLPALGVDLLDVSSGGNSPAQKIPRTERYQVDLASQIREAVRREGGKLLVGAVGRIARPEMARDLVERKKEGEDGEQDADLVFVAKQFLREPAWPVRVAEALGVPLKRAHQYHMVQHKHQTPEEKAADQWRN